MSNFKKPFSDVRMRVGIAWPVSHCTEWHTEARSGHVYLAAGFFTEEQLTVCKAVEDLFEESPWRLHSPRQVLTLEKDASAVKRSDVFSGNLNALRGSAFVLARIDDFDPGVLWEMGWAYHAGVPVVAFTTHAARGLNVMLQCAVEGFVQGLHNVRRLVVDQDWDVCTPGYQEVQ